MPPVKKILLGLLTAILAFRAVLEYLALPALFILIGVLNGFGWRYYVCSVGGYAVAVALVEMAGALVGDKLGRSIGSRLSRMLKRKDLSDSDIEC